MKTLIYIEHRDTKTQRITRYVMRSAMIGAGHNNTFETYLSPLEYQGPEVRFAYETMRMTRLMDGNVSAQNLLQLHATSRKPTILTADW